jgi:hypothetical protein
MGHCWAWALRKAIIETSGFDLGIPLSYYSDSLQMNLKYIIYFGHNHLILACLLWEGRSVASYPGKTHQCQLGIDIANTHYLGHNCGAKKKNLGFGGKWDICVQVPGQVWGSDSLSQLSCP